MGTITEQNIDIAHRAPTNAWHLYVGRDICGNVEEGLNHEWLVTNGLGGYASGSHHWFRVAALGTAGTGPWSNPATTMAA